ncbi:LacI family DNA-binding transcriptional regulator [Streptomyces sp. AcE210]|uniref:LacI family DNA-binding transcriptional regulator n=1 Tax=Streptomyces sp. AcE210 TaxID=2292703 RepID=UPI001405437F|nr:LacI family DNA-binding transcriptional regulator [Streptomyces sp. AcE210]
MSSPLRQEAILREVRLNGSVNVTRIAAELGVSAMTVRRDIAVLAHHGLVTRVYGGAILPRTKPALRSNVPTVPERSRTFVLGMVVPRRSAYYREVIGGVQVVAQGTGSRLMLGVSAYGDERPQVEDMLNAGVDGLLLTPRPDTLRSAEEAAWIRELPVPVVIVERRPEPAAGLDQLDRVASDHARGTVQALRHLVELGHRRVGLLASATPTAVWISRGFDISRAIFTLPAGAPCVADHVAYDFAAVDTFIDALVSTGTTAVVAHPDEQAALLVQRVRARGLAVPDDLAVIAYDDDLASLAEIPLTAVAPARHAVGRLAATRLVQRLREGSRHVVQESLLLPCLAVRASTSRRSLPFDMSDPSTAA